MNSIVDPEVQALAAIAATLEADYAADEVLWSGSPFAWIKARPSRQIGAIGERLVAGWLAAKEFNVARSPDSEADRLVEGMRVEVKFSTLWQNGSYKFQQLRDQNYEFAICLGISPFDAHCWILPKPVIMDRWQRRDGIYSQHGGDAGSDTAWLSVSPTSPLPWLKQYGGSLAEAAAHVAQLTGLRG